MLDSLFTELTPAAAPDAPARRATTDASPFAMATDYLSKGLLRSRVGGDRVARCRAARARRRLTLLGDVFARQGLFGEALERYREALAARADVLRAAIGEAWSLLRLGRAREARPIAEQLLATERPATSTC